MPRASARQPASRSGVSGSRKYSTPSTSRRASVREGGGQAGARLGDPEAGPAREVLDRRRAVAAEEPAGPARRAPPRRPAGGERGSTRPSARSTARRRPSARGRGWRSGRGTRAGGSRAARRSRRRRRPARRAAPSGAAVARRSVPRRRVSRACSIALVGDARAARAARGARQDPWAQQPDQPVAGPRRRPGGGCRASARSGRSRRSPGRPRRRPACPPPSAGRWRAARQAGPAPARRSAGAPPRPAWLDRGPAIRCATSRSRATSCGVLMGPPSQARTTTAELPDSAPCAQRNGTSGTPGSRQWSAEPNRLVAELLGDVPPGRRRGPRCGGGAARALAGRPGLAGDGGRLLRRRPGPRDGAARCRRRHVGAGRRPRVVRAAGEPGSRARRLPAPARGRHPGAAGARRRLAAAGRPAAGARATTSTTSPPAWAGRRSRRSCTASTGCARSRDLLEVDRLEQVPRETPAGTALDTLLWGRRPGRPVAPRR